MDTERRIASITKPAKGLTAPRNYRILWLDDSGQITGSDVFPAEDDAVTIVIARAMESSADRQLWEAERLIAQLPATAV
jgi:hypothetical protein